MKKIFTLFSILIVLGLIGYLYFIWEMGAYGKGATVYLPRGSSVRQMSELLKQNGVLRDAWPFRTLARLKNVQKKLKAGEYQFNAGVTPLQVLEKIVRGERLIRQVTIPEGYNFAQMAGVFSGAEIAPVSETMSYFRNPQLLGLLPFPALSLEGYLFPDTYEYDRETKVEDLLGQMVRRFLKAFDPALQAKGQQAGWTIPQVVTLASIIEKETGIDAERPLISSVFQNRLKVGMPLQSDPTVIYGLPNFDGNIRKEDLSNPHPYNTYVHTNLPPGPIASPGLKSLQAVLNATPSAYLFFVGRGDGTHQFSSNLEEHNAAVAKYQLGQETIPTVPQKTSAETKPAETKPTMNYRHPIMKPSPMARPKP